MFIFMKWVLFYEDQQLTSMILINYLLYITLMVINFISLYCFFMFKLILMLFKPMINSFLLLVIIIYLILMNLIFILIILSCLYYLLFKLQMAIK
jgi:hypothetical protein